MSKSQHIVVIACIVGLIFMYLEKITNDEFWVYLLLVPVLLMLYSKKINKKE
jgi:Na+-transporting NADH:ubiquinone oxidoreductase subunit NqrB